MDFDYRVEEALNAFGQTISDLKTPAEMHQSINRNLLDQTRMITEAVRKENKLTVYPDDIDYEYSILYRDNIIDRMETALVNVLTALRSRCISPDDLLGLRDAGEQD